MLRIDINLIFTIINLLLLTVGLYFFLFKPVRDIIAKRQAEADAEYEKACSDKEEAAGMKAQYEKSLKELEEEKKELLRTARKNADAEYQRIVQNAEERAASITSDAMAQAESTREHVLKRAEREIADMVLEATGKMTGDAVGGKDVNRELYEEFLSKAGERQ